MDGPKRTLTAAVPATSQRTENSCFKVDCRGCNLIAKPRLKASRGRFSPAGRF